MINTQYSEFGISTDAKQVPWADAVVWAEMTSAGHKIYQWLPKKEIRGLNWTSGLLSIEISNDSFLKKDLQYLLIQAPFIAIGVNVPI